MKTESAKKRRKRAGASASVLFLCGGGFLLEIKKRVFILITSWCSCACTEVSS